MNSKERIFSYLKKQKKMIVFLFISAFIYVAAQIGQPFLLGRAIDIARNSDGAGYISLLLIALGLIISGVIAGYIFELIAGIISQRVIKDMRDDIYLKMNSISARNFDVRSHGDLLQLEIRDMENIASGIFAIFKSLIQGIFTVIMTIVLMSMVNWILAVAVIVLTPLSMLMSSFVAKFSHRHFQKTASLQSELNSVSLQSIKNLDVVQSLNSEEMMIKEFEQRNEKLRKEASISQFSASWVNPSTRFVNNTIYVIIGILGIVMIAYEPELTPVFAVMTIGRLSSFLSYTNQYSKPFNEISSVVGEYESAKFSLRRVNDFLNLEDDIDNGSIDIDSIDKIEFKNMNFSYSKEKPLITDFNFIINKGEKIAIVGPTGAGKTTIINLIMRFYDPLNGTIYINDINNLEISKKSLRKNIGMVLQDTWIFNGTIYENIAYTKENAAQEEVYDAARRAHVDSFINSLPDGYQTKVSQKEGLSEGQKQMIAIARIMLLNPEVVILDEATSNIDTRNEKLITKAFDEIMKNKTSIVIAHRLSTIVQADKIIVLKDGNIIEIGNHTSLMEKQGFYHTLFMSQFK